MNYDCSKCPGYCCCIYERVEVDKADVKRLAKHFGIGITDAEQRFTKTYNDKGKVERILRRKKDSVLGQACMFLDLEKRQCTIYDARPKTCRDYPVKDRCVYYDLIQYENEMQGSPTLVQITFVGG
jgi:Fe-S-cluster containining protein